MRELQGIRFLYDGKKKVSHDYEGKSVTTFPYQQLIANGIPNIGIAAKQSGLVIIDVDVQGTNHSHDGRAWWEKYMAENNIGPTYTVQTPSGGYHFYFRIPDHINPDTFHPPGQLALGVDVKYNGWVGAPPTMGYIPVYGDPTHISEIPAPLLQTLIDRINEKPAKAYEVTYEEGMSLALHRPYTKAQINDLRKKLEWFQVNGEVSYSEWRDGLFALKAGIDDPAILDEFVEMWTMNRSYQAGDEEQAREIVERATKHGPIGPGSIFTIIKEVALRQGGSLPISDLSPQEVFDRSGVDISVDQNGRVNIVSSESNVAAILGTIFGPDILFHDIRMDLYMFKGEAYSDNELVNILCPIIQSTKSGLGLQKIKKATIGGGLDVLMAARQKDPHLEWLNSLQWDGQNRIDTFFPFYVGCEDSEYTRAVSRNFWIALVARTLNPGCKFDHIVVLEGKEGIAKSTLVGAIGGVYTYAPNTRKIFEDLDGLRKMHQSIIVELPELMGLVNEDSNMVKAFLSQSEDSIRALFAKRAKKHPRGFIFVGTTNDRKYLSLDMGRRRFWPIEIKSNDFINISRINIDRAQLFAEAVVRFRKGESFHEVPQEADTIARRRIKQEPLKAALEKILQGVYEITIEEAYSRLSVQGYINRGLNTKISERIEVSLRQLGFDEDLLSGGQLWRRESCDIEADATVINRGVDLAQVFGNQNTSLSSFI